MKMMKALLVGLVAFAALLVPSTALALPTATFTVSSSQQTQGVAYHYDSAGSVCDIPPCSYAWRYYRTSSPDRLGTTLGSGPVGDFKIYDAGRFTVTLKVTNSGSTHGYSTYSRVVTVSAPVLAKKPGNDWE